MLRAMLLRVENVACRCSSMSFMSWSVRTGSVQSAQSTGERPRALRNDQSGLEDDRPERSQELYLTQLELVDARARSANIGRWYCRRRCECHRSEREGSGVRSIRQDAQRHRVAATRALGVERNVVSRTEAAGQRLSDALEDDAAVLVLAEEKRRRPQHASQEPTNNQPRGSAVDPRSQDSHRGPPVVQAVAVQSEPAVRSPTHASSPCHASLPSISANTAITNPAIGSSHVQPATA